MFLDLDLLVVLAHLGVHLDVGDNVPVVAGPVRPLTPGRLVELELLVVVCRDLLGVAALGAGVHLGELQHLGDGGFDHSTWYANKGSV